ncbi:MAG: response regulator transcription factor [Actinomycetia bacterium]|nr:response regulator transcription factor [Actinomycetes bacterium]
MSEPVKILVVDDDAPLREFLRRNLEARNFDVQQAATGLEALALVRHEEPDLVVLDIMMPHLDGYATCLRLREFTDVPTIVLTALGGEADIVHALDCGADDCLTKPFGVDELLARVRSVLRRAKRTTPTDGDESVIEYRDLRIDIGAYRAWVRGEQLDLTRTEFSVLRVYATNLSRTVPHQFVLSAVWGDGYDSHAHYVRIYVSRLRAKIEADGDEPYFATEHGLGYRLG